MAYTPYQLEPLGACCAACARGRSCSGAPLGEVTVQRAGIYVAAVIVASLLIRKWTR
jgi:hypothetical protein